MEQLTGDFAQGISHKITRSLGTLLTLKMQGRPVCASIAVVDSAAIQRKIG
jgi:hypothetical protein